MLQYTAHVLGVILALPDDFNESVQLIAVSCLLTVQKIPEVLPNRLTVDILEQLRISKQTLVELGSRAGVLRQMLFGLLEDPHEIRRICITLKKGNAEVECSVPLEKQIADGDRVKLIEPSLHVETDNSGQGEEIRFILKSDIDEVRAEWTTWVIANLPVED